MNKVTIESKSGRVNTMSNFHPLVNIDQTQYKVIANMDGGKLFLLIYMEGSNTFAWVEEYGVSVREGFDNFVSAACAIAHIRNHADYVGESLEFNLKNLHDNQVLDVLVCEEVEGFISIYL